MVISISTRYVPISTEMKRFRQLPAGTKITTRQGKSSFSKSASGNCLLGPFGLYKDLLFAHYIILHLEFNQFR